MDRTGMVGLAKLSLVAAAIVAIVLLAAASPFTLADYLNVTGLAIDVSLIQPANNGSYINNNNNNTLNFSFTPFTRNSTAVLGNCTLATNITGTWQYNASNSSTMTNGTASPTSASGIFYGGSIPDGAYSWNVYCFDNAGVIPANGQAGFNSTNFTVRVDTVAPTLTAVLPGNGSLISNRNATVFEVFLNDSHMNSGQNISVFYRRSGVGTYQHTKLSCFDNNTRGVAPGVSNGSSSSFCNTSVDLATNVSLGTTDVLQYFFNTTDIANNSGTNGTQSSPMTATADELAPTVTVNSPATLANLSAGVPNAGAIGLLTLASLNITVTDTNRNLTRMYATIGNSTANFSINQSIRVGDLAGAAPTWSILTRTGTTDYFTTSFETTNFTDGGYTIYFNATDNANNSRIASVDVNIDNNATHEFQYGAGTFANNTNTTQNFILANVTFSENRTAWCTFEFNNATGINRTLTIGPNASHTNKTSCYYNLTGVPDGRHRYLVYVNDTANNTNASAARNITIDTVAPTSAFNVSTNLTKVFPGGFLRTNFTFTDATSGFLGQSCGVTLMNGTGAQSNVSILADRNITMAAMSVEIDGTGTGWCNMSVALPSNLTNGNNYTVMVTVNDASGNNAQNNTLWVTIDDTAPTIVVNSPAASVSGRNLTGAADLFNITVDDANLNASAVYAIISNTTHNFTLNGTTAASVINGPPGNWTTMAQGACAANGSTCFFHTALLSNNYNSSHNASTYTMYFYAADTANKTTWTGFTFDIDNNATEDLQFFVNTNTTFLSNNSNLSQTYLFLNATFRENNTNGCIIEITNATAANFSMTKHSSNNTICNVNLSLPNNYYRYRIYVNDSAGNTGASSQFNVTLDTTAPVLTIPTPASSSFFTNVSSGATTFNITITEANLNASNVTVFFRKSGVGNYQRRALTCTTSGSTSTCNTSADISALVASGEILEYFFNATDVTMNNSGTNGTQSVPLTSTVDEGGPVVTLPVYTNATYRNSSTSLTLNISGIDNGVGVGGPCKVTVANTSGAINQTIAFSGGWCNGTVDMANIQDGNRTLTVYLNDSLGNVGNATAGYGVNNSYYVYVDSLAPNSTAVNYTTAGTYPLQANTSSGKFNLSVYLNDSATMGTLNGSGLGLSGVCLVSVGGTANQTATVSLADTIAGTGWCNATGLVLTGVANGNQTVTVWYNDSVGNRATNSTLLVWVDSSAPNITMANASTQNASIHNRSGILNLTVLVDDSDGVGVAGPCVFNVPGAANYSAAGIARAGVNNGWCNTSNMTLASATEGNQTVTVWANDTLGNIRTNTTFTVWIDPAAPNITSFNVTNNTNISGSSSLHFAVLANDSTGTGVSNCLIYAAGQTVNTTTNATMVAGGGAVAGLYWCNGTLSMTGATAGTNFLTIYANDSVNNTGNSSNNFAIVVDATAPTILGFNNTHFGSNGAMVNGTQVQVGNNFTINYSVTEAGAGFAGECQVYVNTTFADNFSVQSFAGGVGWCNGSVQVPTNLSAQNHTLNVSVRDSAGNWGSNASFVVSVTADSTAPTVVLYNATHMTSAYTNFTLAKPGVTTIRLNASVDDGSGSGLTASGACYIILGGTRVTESVTLSAVSSSFGWCNGTVTVPAGLGSANQSINITFPDVANNNGSNVTHTVDVDGTVPTVNFVRPGNTSNLSGSTLLNMTITDVHNTSLVAFYKLGNTTGNYSKAAALSAQTSLSQDGTSGYFNDTLDTTLFQDGNYTLWVTVNDSINNINTTYVNITIDNTAPAIVVNALANGTNITSTADLVNITVTDANMNVSAIYATLGNTTGNYSINLTAREGDLNATTGSSWTLMTRTGATSYYTANISTDSFQNGAYTIYYNATDSANNTRIRSSQNITIDNTAPTVSSWNYSFVNKTLRIAFSENISRDSVTLASINVSDNDSSVVYGGLAALTGATVQAHNASVLAINFTDAQNGQLANLFLIPGATPGAHGKLGLAASAVSDTGSTGNAVSTGTYISNWTRWCLDIPLPSGSTVTPVTAVSATATQNSLDKFSLNASAANGGCTWLGGNYTVTNVLQSVIGNLSIAYYLNTSTDGGNGNWTSFVPGRAANDLVNADGTIGSNWRLIANASDRLQILGASTG